MAKILACVCILALLVAVPSYSQVTFTNVTESAKINGANFMYVNLGDYNNDGYIDIATSTFGKGRRLYRNEGNGSFKDVTEITGAYGSGYYGVYFLDFDNDGNLDLFMSGTSAKGSSFEHGDRLLQNKGDETFIDVSKKAGLDPNARNPRYGSCESVSFDFDNDGLLDIFVANSDCTPIIPNYLYHNEGNGRFKEMAEQIGLNDPHIDGVVPGDYNNDGKLDIFMTVSGKNFLDNNLDPEDQGIDMLYHNEGNGIYVNVAKEAGVARNASHLSGFFFDYDNDGDLDLFLRALEFGDIDGYNILYRNNEDGTFSEVTKQAGILPIEGWTFGTDYGDYDNDGWLDICVTYQSGNFPFLLYHNNHDGTFTDISAQVAISSHLSGGSIGIFMDYNNDGYLDILSCAGNTILYKNNGTNNHWLQLKLVGKQSNRDAIGARVRVIANELSMIRGITSASHHQHQDRTPIHFGLGDNIKADMIEIKWPSGIVQTFTNIPADQKITIDEVEGILTLVRQVIPDSGHPDGGTAVQIQGESFLPGSKVLFGGIEAKYVRVETSTLITAVAPSGVKGLVDVEVVNPDGSRGILRNGFRYSTIQVTKITPDSGPTVGGIQIQIEGSGFQQGAVVKLGDNQLTNLFVTPVLLKGILPAGTSGTIDVSVTNPDGETTVLKNMFTYIPPPTIDDLRTDIGPLMSFAKIGIYGSGFIRTPSVHIGGIASQSVTFISSDSLEVDMPQIPTTGPQDVLVINPDGQRVTLPGGLTIIAPPKIKSITPTSGSLDGGTVITITGDSVVEANNKTYISNLKEIRKVLVGEVECSEVTVKSDYIVTAITPSNTPGMKSITIIDSLDQDDTLENAFSYNNAPQITKIMPDNGKLAGGTQVTIIGNGFLPGAEVIVRMGDGFNVVALSTQVLSSTTITAIMPPGKPGDKDITIRNTDGQEISSSGGFTYNPMPTIARITPNYCASSGGSKIIIEGTGFMLGARVIIGEKVTAAQVKDDMAIEVVAPSNRQGVYDVRIINPDTQEVVMPKGLITVGEKAYNYPNPFNASQGTTFRYVTQDSIQTMTVKIFNLAGIPIDIVQGTGSNEVRWQNDDTRAGAYIYIMEVKLSDNSNKNFKGVLEVSN